MHNLEFMIGALGTPGNKAEFFYSLIFFILMDYPIFHTY